MKNTKKLKIVLAEDEAFILRAYGIGLEKAGYEVLSAKTGTEALSLIKKHKPDLVLMDVMMPEKNGYEVLETMKGDDDLKNIPVIIMTNLSQNSDVEIGKKLGAVDYLVKADHSLKEIVEKINNYFKNH